LLESAGRGARRRYRRNLALAEMGSHTTRTIWSRPATNSRAVAADRPRWQFTTYSAVQGTPTNDLGPA